MAQKLGHSDRVTPESFHEAALRASGCTIDHHADARLDNREELFSIFQIPASEQASFPDSLLILEAYRRWGSDCPKYLLGDFAFAVFDEREQRLFCARDILGIRPFYYYLDRDIFAFSSDIAALLESPLVPVELNLSFVHSYLVKPVFFEKEFTFYQHVHKLLPATSIVIEPGKVTRQEFWSPGNSSEIRFQREEEYVECLLELLTDAVACRIRTAFPTGSHLSSGLDSSTISIIAARILRQDQQILHTFSWAPPPTPDEYPLKDERQIVEKISQIEQTIQHFTRITSQDIVSLQTRDITRQPGESLHFESIVCKLAAESGLRVLLSRWGGDEVVAFNGRELSPTSSAAVDGR
jgi:asparagine synthase (glutamine-hydrolysing)